MMCDADRKSANQRCMYECMDRPAKLCSRESGAMDEFLHVWVVTPGGRTSQPCWLLRACDLARPRPSAAPRRLCVRPCVACRWRIRGRDPSSYTVPATHRICLPSVSGPLSIHPGSTAAAWIWQISRKFHRTRRPAASRTCRSIGPPTKPSSTLHFFFICFLFAAYCTPVRTYVHAHVPIQFQLAHKSSPLDTDRAQPFKKCRKFIKHTVCRSHTNTQDVQA